MIQYTGINEYVVLHIGKRCVGKFPYDGTDGSLVHLFDICLGTMLSTAGECELRVFELQLECVSVEF